MDTVNFFTLYRSLIRLIPPSGLTIICMDHDSESGRSWKCKDALDPLSAVRSLRDACKHRGQVDVDDLTAIRTLEDVKQTLAEAYSEQGVNVMFVGTPVEADDYEAEQERLRLERKASEIAASLGVRIDSFEFIAALEDRMASEGEIRASMREDGLCIGFGVTPDQWRDDFNYSQSEEAGYEDVLAFLNKYCPLLMAQYSERKLSGDAVEQIA